MMLGYFQRPSYFHDWKGQQDDGLASKAAAAGKRPRAVSRPGGFLAPVAILLRGTAEVVNSGVLYIRDGLTDEERNAKARLEEQKQIWHLRLQQARTSEEWSLAARELDVLENNEAWKAENASEDFDVELVEARWRQMETARIGCNVVEMLHLLRTSLSRDLGGMGNTRLYMHSYIGTKDLIEQYIDSTLATVKSLVSMVHHSQQLPAGLDTSEILSQVIATRQAFGRSALLLSGGATFGMMHIGVLKALFEADMLPRIISGASAGSIVCAVMCTRTDEEIPGLVRDFPHGDLAVFEEASREEGLLQKLGRFLTRGAWNDIRHLIRVMQTMVGDITFQEAYNKTRRILNICVSSASTFELPQLLNYITSPNVMIWSAVVASCSVPGVFNETDLLVKNPLTGEYHSWHPTPQRWIDGSVDNDIPMTRLAEMFNVNHFIVSQVNPHVVPFLARDDAALTHSSQPPSYVSTAAASLLNTVTQLAKDEALHRMQMLADIGILPNLITKARSILSQRYSGDITILPEIKYKDFPRMLKNPTVEFMEEACLSGERATWPKLSRIRNHCAIELALDSAVRELRARVAFSPSQANLRRLGTGSTFGNLSISQTITPASPTRRRRVSSSNALLASRDEGSDDYHSSDSLGDADDNTSVPNSNVPKARNSSVYRPPPLLRAVSTTFTHSSSNTSNEFSRSLPGSSILSLTRSSPANPNLPSSIPDPTDSTNHNHTTPIPTTTTPARAPNQISLHLALTTVHASDVMSPNSLLSDTNGDLGSSELGDEGDGGTGTDSSAPELERDESGEAAAEINAEKTTYSSELFSRKRRANVTPGPREDMRGFLDGSVVGALSFGVLGRRSGAATVKVKVEGEGEGRKDGGEVDGSLWG